jgi:cobalt-zinc-cadmium efflux system membrane fusion protein
MLKHMLQRVPWYRVAFGGVIVIGVLGIMVLPPVRTTIHGWLVGDAKAASSANTTKSEELEYFEKNDIQGLHLPEKAVVGLGLRPIKARLATEGRPLPPQIGTLNYDNDRIFAIRSRFPGELAEVTQVLDADGPITPTRQRPLRFGDKVKQGDRLAVIWSQPFGAAKAALVDAVCALRLSQETLKRYEDLHQKGAMALASVKIAERQVQADSNSLLTAERSLKMWKLEKQEIEEIKAEANVIHDQKKSRSADDEMKWARVEIKVPWFDKTNPNRELIVVEKNTNLNDMVDPINSPPLFKLADTSRLQIWVHPPEEYLPLIRAGLKKGPGGLQWDIRFQSEARETPAAKLDIVQIAPSLEPNQHTPMVLGYLPNPEGKYLIGQFVTATIYMPPDKDTVEIPTDALNEVEGQAYVFVQSDSGKHDYSLRRVAVVRRFKDVTFVRAKLGDDDKKVSDAEVARGRRPLQPLLPDERVITRGVCELTSALEELAIKSRIARKKAEASVTE